MSTIKQAYLEGAEAAIQEFGAKIAAEYGFDKTAFTDELRALLGQEQEQQPFWTGTDTALGAGSLGAGLGGTALHRYASGLEGAAGGGGGGNPLAGLLGAGGGAGGGGGLPGNVPGAGGPAFGGAGGNAGLLPEVSQVGQARDVLQAAEEASAAGAKPGRGPKGNKWRNLMAQADAAGMSPSGGRPADRLGNLMAQAGEAAGTGGSGGMVGSVKGRGPTALVPAGASALAGPENQAAANALAMFEHGGGGPAGGAARSGLSLSPSALKTIGRGLQGAGVVGGGALALKKLYDAFGS